MRIAKLVSCVTFLGMCGLAFGQQQPPPTTQTHPLYPLNIGDRWTYRNVDLKTPAPNTEQPKKTIIEVEGQESYSSKDAKGEVKKHVGFILKSSSGKQEKHDHVVILEDGVHVVHRAKTALTPPLNVLKFPLKQDEKW